MVPCLVGGVAGRALDPEAEAEGGILEAMKKKAKTEDAERSAKTDEPKKLPARVTITCATDRKGEHLMRIEIQDLSSRIEVVTVEMGMAEFALALAHHGYQPAEAEWRGLDLVGWVAENKTEEVEFENQWGERKEKQEASARLALMKHEVNGWRGNMSDLFNGHKRVRAGVQRVSFFRYVKPKDPT